MPDSLLVLGGGAIGVELAQVFARFGSQVTVVEAADRLLAGRSPRPATCWPEVFGREGIGVHTGASCHRGRTYDGTASPVDPRRRRRARPARRCWWPPAGGPTWPALGVGARRARREPRASTSTTGSAGRAQAYGRSATSPARAPSPTCPCTRPASPCATSSASPAPRRRLPRAAPGHLHRPGDRRGRADRGAGPRTRPGRAHRSRSPAPPGAGSTRRATRASSSWSRTPAAGPGRRDLGRADRRRGARRARRGRPRRVPLGTLRADDLRLPDFPPRYRGRAHRPGLISDTSL